MSEKLGILALWLGALLAGTGAVVVLAEAWTWLQAGRWHNIPTATLLARFADWAPRSLSASRNSELFFSLLDVPLHDLLAAAGLGLIVLGLLLLR